MKSRWTHHVRSANAGSSRAKARARGFSLIELLVGLFVFSGMMYLVFRFSRDMFVAHETVEKGIELDTLRWYIRDRLDCRQSLGIADGTRLPLNCSDYKFGGLKLVELRTRPPAGATAGQKISNIISKTNWQIRSYCEDNALVVEYRPVRDLPVDEARRQALVQPSDLIPPRMRNPEQLRADPVMPSELGFRGVKPNEFASNEYEKCPPSNSFGPFMAIANFAANSILNSATVQNKAIDDIEKRWGKDFPGIKDPIHGHFGQVVSASESWKGVAGGTSWIPALQGAAVQADKVASDWLGGLVENAFKKSGQAVLGAVGQNVMAGNGIGNLGNLAQNFAVGGLDNMLGAVGAPPLAGNFANAMKNGDMGIWAIVQGAPTLDSKLNMAAKIPLQMFVAMTDVNNGMEMKMQNATNAMVKGLEEGLPNNQIAQNAVQALADFDNYLRVQAPTRFGFLMDKLVTAPMRQATLDEVSALKQQMAQRFAQMEADLKASDASPQAKAAMLKVLAEKRVAVMAAIDAAKAQADKMVADMVEKIKKQFSDEMARIAGDKENGFRAVIEKFLADVQAAKNFDPKNMAAALADKLLGGVKMELPAGDVGKLRIPEPPWRDLFDGAARFCRNEFTLDPMRDFADDANPCGFVHGGEYPIFVRTHNGRPICCKEVETASATGPLGHAQCKQNEVAWSGGAECSNDGLGLTGGSASRPEVLPVLQGRGVAIATGLKTEVADGGIWPPPNSAPIPHPHSVQGGFGGGKNVVAGLMVNEVYRKTPKYLGGFLRASTPPETNAGGSSSYTGACYWANRPNSRHNDWVQPHSVTSRALCCPVIGY